MNKFNPKKIMEIIFIFIIPLLLVLANGVFYKSKDITNVSQDVVIEGTIAYFEYDAPIIDEGPIKDVLNITFDLLGFNDGYIKNALVDYTTLWFTMFIIWHLLYLFFDTLMHKVLLRKD